MVVAFARNFATTKKSCLQFWVVAFVVDTTSGSSWGEVLTNKMKQQLNVTKSKIYSLTWSFRAFGLLFFLYVCARVCKLLLMNILDRERKTSWKRASRSRLELKWVSLHCFCFVCFCLLSLNGLARKWKAWAACFSGCLSFARPLPCFSFLFESTETRLQIYIVQNSKLLSADKPFLFATFSNWFYAIVRTNRTYNRYIEKKKNED